MSRKVCFFTSLFCHAGNQFWAPLTPVAPESAPESTVPSKETTPAPETNLTGDLTQEFSG